MDILIKGMEMPKACEGCPLCFLSSDGRNFFCTRQIGKRFDLSLSDQRQEGCPLVPVPQLIDYKTESDVLLKLWMDKIITDGEYNKIMERLNKAVVLEGTT